MSIDFMSLGRQAFNDGMQEEEIKTQHPQFRSGWREAKKQFDAKNKPVSALRPERVERIDPERRWKLQWKDLSSIADYYPWNRLQRVAELEPIVVAMKRVVWSKREEVVHFNDAVRMYEKMWFGMLQQGYDQGTLTINDLKRYNFTPKQNEQV